MGVATDAPCDGAASIPVLLSTGPSVVGTFVTAQSVFICPQGVSARKPHLGTRAIAATIGQHEAVGITKWLSLIPEQERSEMTVREFAASRSIWLRRHRSVGSARKSCLAATAAGVRAP